MNPFFQFDTEENRKKLLSRARNVALTALQQYELDRIGIRFIQLSDTITYKIETESMSSYLLRIHSDRLDQEEILSEIVFLNELKNIYGLQVPTGIASRKGHYVMECETEEGYQKPYVSLMSWIEGEPISGEFPESHAHKTGVLMGRLHEASSVSNVQRILYDRIGGLKVLEKTSVN